MRSPDESRKQRRGDLWHDQNRDGGVAETGCQWSWTSRESTGTPLCFWGGDENGCILGFPFTFATPLPLTHADRSDFLIFSLKLVRRSYAQTVNETMNYPFESPIFFRRYSAGHLCDVIYSIQPMSLDLAEAVRTLRRDHAVDYTQLGFFLCESDPDSGASFGLGRSLVELAARQFGDHDPAWI